MRVERGGHRALLAEAVARTRGSRVHRLGHQHRHAGGCVRHRRSSGRARPAERAARAGHLPGQLHVHHTTLHHRLERAVPPDEVCAHVTSAIGLTREYIYCVRIHVKVECTSRHGHGTEIFALLVVGAQVLEEGAVAAELGVQALPRGAQIRVAHAHFDQRVGPVLAVLRVS